MSHSKKPVQSDSRSSAAGRGAIPLPGVPGDFAEMMSSLPDADSAGASAEEDAGPPVIASAGISDMFSNLPDADPASAAPPASKSGDEPTDASLSDFELRTDIIAPMPAVSRTASLPRGAGRGSPPTGVRRAPQRSAATQAAARANSADDLPPGVADVLFDDPPTPRIAPTRRPVAGSFRQPAPAPAEDTIGPARSTNSRRTPAVNRPSNLGEPAEEIGGRTITRQILDLLEQNGLAAVSQLRIEVHNGVVV